MFAPRLFLVCATAVGLTATPAVAALIDFRTLGTFQTPALSVGGVTVTGIAPLPPLPGETNLIDVSPFGLGVGNGSVSSPGTLSPGTSEFIRFDFDAGQAADIWVAFEVFLAERLDGIGVEAFTADGSSLGAIVASGEYDSPVPFRVGVRVSDLYGDQPIGAFTLTPLNPPFTTGGNLFTVGALQFTPTPAAVPEPSSSLLLGLWMGGLAFATRARRRSS